MTTFAVDLRDPTHDALRRPSDRWRSRPGGLSSPTVTNSMSEQMRVISLNQRDVGLLVDPEIARVAIASGTDWQAEESTTSRSVEVTTAVSLNTVPEVVNDDTAGADEHALDAPRQLMSLPAELIALVLEAVKESSGLLACRTVSTTLMRLASSEDLWRRRSEAVLTVAHGPVYAAHLAALLSDPEIPAYQCFWIAARVARAPSEARVRDEFLARSVIGCPAIIRSHHVSPLLRALFGEEVMDAPSHAEAGSWILCLHALSAIPRHPPHSTRSRTPSLPQLVSCPVCIPLSGGHRG